MDSQAVQRIAELGGGYKIEEINGYKFHVSHTGARRLDFPTVDLTELFSLNQAVNFVAALVGGDTAGELSVGDKSQILINVANETDIEIVDGEYNESLCRNVYAKLDATSIFSEFESGRKMNQEEFIVELMTKFVQDDATMELLKLVSEIKADGETKYSDSGFSQTVHVKAGVALVKEKDVKNLFQLRTYRTFPEVDQPVIPYILRLHDGGRDGKPLFALYAADGGQWKVTATSQIREYFTNQLKTKLGENFSRVTVL